MSLIDQIAQAFEPHVHRAIDSHNHYMASIVDTLRESRQEADLGAPDTGDQFKFIIQTGVLAAGNQVLGGPTLGEIWVIQSIATNGVPVKTPAFTVRTNTGRLIFAMTAEAMGSESVSGRVILLQGEVLELISAGGTFDFTISVTQRKYKRDEPNAGYGISEEVFETRFRGEHEVERDALPALGHASPHAPTQQQ